MKCDELKDYDYDPDFPFQSRGRFYVADEVEAAIAELEQKLQDQCMSCPVKKQEDDVVAEFKEKLEDAGMRERRLRRALYKACANWAHHRVFVRFKTNEKAWEKVERKCRAKMEEYK